MTCGKAKKGAHEYLVNVIWPLSPFRRENGATLIYPGSHGRDGMAREDLADPIAAECDPGAAICFLGSTAHGAGANLTDLPRRAIVVGYCLGWLKPYENQWLAYPRRSRGPSRANWPSCSAMSSIAPISAIMRANARRSC